jgi:hypothetical protein
MYLSTQPIFGPGIVAKGVTTAVSETLLRFPLQNSLTMS